MKTIKMPINTFLSETSVTYALDQLPTRLNLANFNLLVHKSQQGYAEKIVEGTECKVVVVEQNDTDDWALEVGDYRIEVTAP